MAKTGHTVDNPVTGDRVVFLQTAADTNDKGSVNFDFDDRAVEADDGAGVHFGEHKAKCI